MEGCPSFPASKHGIDVIPSPNRNTSASPCLMDPYCDFASLYGSYPVMERSESSNDGQADFESTFEGLDLSAGASTSAQHAEEWGYSMRMAYNGHITPYGQDYLAEDDAQSEYHTNLWLHIKSRLDLGFLDEALSTALEKSSRDPLPATFDMISDDMIEELASDTNHYEAEGGSSAIHAINTLLVDGFRLNTDRTLRAHALREAACQIILRLPDDGSSYVLCQSTLQNAVASVGPKSAETKPKAKAVKTLYTCAKCQKTFGRWADVDRHNEMMHVERKRTEYFCDYKNCPRHDKNPFYRQDHCREHYRDYHYEDLLRRFAKPDSTWWADRSKALSRGWFRCNKCLEQRVDILKDGYTCPKCGHACEAERQRRRREF
ncbi:hypothetical protein B0T14DRAFT_570710 [Immersiella caudata]|uniref:C2H2-type domain-containing protein n=1 Tax=Immersiella caudata TaxID=314043 RepID=A0AA39TX39_9PEZI|nr:hypothetical protein B0T14DRAFT_570710 [Immersiella caudata]